MFIEYVLFFLNFLQFNGIHLSNSVFDSDCKRLEFLTKQRDVKQQGDRCPYRHGTVIYSGQDFMSNISGKTGCFLFTMCSTTLFTPVN